MRTESLLRWYPREWRERYGEELVALVADDLGGRRPGAGYALALAWAGLVERARASALVGRERPAAERARAGALVVLSAWCATTLAGAAFAKIAEHFSTALAPARRPGAQGAYDVVVAGAVLGAVAILAGAAVALPSARRAWREGRLADLRTRTRLAGALAAGAALALVGLASWAAHLDAAQRNGADGAYAAAAVGWSVLAGAAAVTACAWAAGVGRRCALSRKALAAERALCALCALGALGVAAGIVAWWVLMAQGAPAFLGSPGAPAVAPPPLVTAAGLGAVAALVALYGAARALRARI